MSTTIDAYSALNASGSGSGGTRKADEPGSAERFLKLLVTQMQNQDPLNPMDNAQITSQIAQINTVSGIEKLNTTVGTLNTQFVQMQALQGASLIGREVTLQGNRLDVADGVAEGGYELASAADAVKLEVLATDGRVIDTQQLGAQTAGRHDLSWAAANYADGAELRFRITATAGAKAVTSTLLMRDHVEAVSTEGGSLVLQTRYTGDVAYGDVKAFN